LITGTRRAANGGRKRTAWAAFSRHIDWDFVRDTWSSRIQAADHLVKGTSTSRTLAAWAAVLCRVNHWNLITTTNRCGGQTGGKFIIGALPSGVVGGLIWLRQRWKACQTARRGVEFGWVPSRTIGQAEKHVETCGRIAGLAYVYFASVAVFSGAARGWATRQAATGARRSLTWSTSLQVVIIACHHLRSAATAGAAICRKTSGAGRYFIDYRRFVDSTNADSLGSNVARAPVVRGGKLHNEACSRVSR